jgi:hypothetical protein
MAKSDKKEKKASVKVKEGKKAVPPAKVAVVSSKEVLEKAHVCRYSIFFLDFYGANFDLEKIKKGSCEAREEG